MAQNPLASYLRFQNLVSWYFGTWSDRWPNELWRTIRLRALPQSLGIAWYIGLYGLIRVGPFNRLFWMAFVLITGYLIGLVIFPTLHRDHYYYQVENAIFICAAAALIIEAFY